MHGPVHRCAFNFCGFNPAGKNKIVALRQLRQYLPKGRQHDPFGPVALYGAAQLFAYANADPTLRQMVAFVVNNNLRQNQAFAAPVKATEFLIQFKRSVFHKTAPLIKHKGHLRFKWPGCTKY